MRNERENAQMCAEDMSGNGIGNGVNNVIGNGIARGVETHGLCVSDQRKGEAEGAETHDTNGAETHDRASLQTIPNANLNAIPNANQPQNQSDRPAERGAMNFMLVAGKFLNLIMQIVPKVGLEWSRRLYAVVHLMGRDADFFALASSIAGDYNGETKRAYAEWMRAMQTYRQLATTQQFIEAAEAYRIPNLADIEDDDDEMWGEGEEDVNGGGNGIENGVGNGIENDVAHYVETGHAPSLPSPQNARQNVSPNDCTNGVETHGLCVSDQKEGDAEGAETHDRASLQANPNASENDIQNDGNGGGNGIGNGVENGIARGVGAGFTPARTYDADACGNDDANGERAGVTPAPTGDHNAPQNASSTAEKNAEITVKSAPKTDYYEEYMKFSEMEDEEDKKNVINESKNRKNMENYGKTAYALQEDERADVADIAVAEAEQGGVDSRNGCGSADGGADVVDRGVREACYGIDGWPYGIEGEGEGAQNQRCAETHDRASLQANQNVSPNDCTNVGTRNVETGHAPSLPSSQNTNQNAVQNANPNVINNGVQANQNASDFALSRQIMAKYGVNGGMRVVPNIGAHGVGAGFTPARTYDADAIHNGERAGVNPAPTGVGMLKAPMQDGEYTHRQVQQIASRIAQVMPDATFKKVSYKSINEQFDSVDLARSKPLFGPFVHQGDVAGIVAESNVGKTIFAMQIAEYLTSGRHGVKGIINSAGAQKVAFLSAEMTKEQMKRRYSNAMGQTYRFSENLIYVDSNLDSEERMIMTIKDLIVKENPDVFIIDSLCQVADSDLTKMVQVKPLLKQFKEIAKETGKTFLIILHTRKRQASDRKKDAMDKYSLYGSSAITNMFDSLMALDASLRDQSKILTQIKCRDGEIVYNNDNALFMSIVKDEPDNFLRFVVDRIAPIGNHLVERKASEIDLQQERQKAIVKACYERGVIRKPYVLHKAFGIGTGTVYRWYDNLRSGMPLQSEYTLTAEDVRAIEAAESGYQRMKDEGMDAMF